MIPPVFNTLTANGALVALVGQRIYGSGQATQDKARPYIVWQVVSSVPNNTLGCLPDQDDMRVQIDVYSTSEQVCRQIATLVRDTIEPVMHITFGPWNSFEDETKLYRWSMDVTWLLDR